MVFVASIYFWPGYRGSGKTMVKCKWITALTLAILIAGKGAGYAQNSDSEANGPANIEQTAPKTLPIPFPVQIVEDDGRTEARQRHEQEARQREIDDLVAQQGMNEATQSMERANWRMVDQGYISLLLVLVGTFLLIWTLTQGRNANKTAQKALVVAQGIGHWQIRPYLLVELELSWNFAPHDSEKSGPPTGWCLTLLESNTGVTPAIVDEANLVFNTWENDEPIGDAFDPRVKSSQNQNLGLFGDFVQPSAKPTRYNIQFDNLKVLKELGLENRYASLGIEIRYRDVSGHKYKLRGVWTIRVKSHKNQDGTTTAEPLLEFLGVKESTDLKFPTGVYG